MTHKFQCGSSQHVSGGDHPPPGLGRPSTATARMTAGARGRGLLGGGGQGQLGWVESLGRAHPQVRGVVVDRVRVGPV